MLLEVLSTQNGPLRTEAAENHRRSLIADDVTDAKSVGPSSRGGVRVYLSSEPERAGGASVVQCREAWGAQASGSRSGFRPENA